MHMDPMSVVLGRKEMHPDVLKTLPEAEWKNCCSGLTLSEAIKKLNLAQNNHRQNMVINVNYPGCHRNVTETSGSYR